MGFKRKIADWMFEHTTFPNGRHAEPNRLWFMKGNCVVCVADPYEELPNGEYVRKYPAIYTLTLGCEKFQMCAYHGKKLAERLRDEFLLEEEHGQGKLE